MSLNKPDIIPDSQKPDNFLNLTPSDKIDKIELEKQDQPQPKKERKPRKENHQEFICEICKKVYKSQGWLQKHIDVQHKKDAELDKQPAIQQENNVAGVKQAAAPALINQKLSQPFTQGTLSSAINICNFDQLALYLAFPSVKGRCNPYLNIQGARLVKTDKMPSVADYHPFYISMKKIEAQDVTLNNISKQVLSCLNIYYQKLSDIFCLFLYSLSFQVYDEFYISLTIFFKSLIEYYQLTGKDQEEGGKLLNLEADKDKIIKFVQDKNPLFNSNFAKDFNTWLIQKKLTEHEFNLVEVN